MAFSTWAGSLFDKLDDIDFDLGFQVGLEGVNAKLADKETVEAQQTAKTNRTIIIGVVAVVIVAIVITMFVLKNKNK